MCIFVFSYLCFRCAQVCLRALSLHISCCFCNIYSMQMSVNAKVCVCVKSTLNMCLLIHCCMRGSRISRNASVLRIQHGSPCKFGSKILEKALIFKCPKCSKIIRRLIHHTNKKEVHRMRCFYHAASCRSPDHAEQGIHELEMVDCIITQIWPSQQVTREHVDNQEMGPYNVEE